MVDSVFIDVKSNCTLSTLGYFSICRYLLEWKTYYTMYLCLILLDFKVVNVALYNTENKSITFMPSKKFIWPGKDIMH